MWSWYMDKDAEPTEQFKDTTTAFLTVRAEAWNVCWYVWTATVEEEVS